MSTDTTVNPAEPETRLIGMTLLRRNIDIVLDRVALGESFIVTRRGLPVAMLKPPVQEPVSQQRKSD
jgi:antitoxin (DNA-binding transcriptional repressor) of toxin-antitoxin stability system